MYPFRSFIVAIVEHRGPRVDPHLVPIEIVENTHQDPQRPLSLDSRPAEVIDELLRSLSNRTGRSRTRKDDCSIMSHR